MYKKNNTAYTEVSMSTYGICYEIFPQNIILLVLLGDKYVFNKLITTYQVQTEGFNH